ncbi:WhiB family transcriptional regulator [Streptomyces sp. NPDC051577]|uniref:WhiB family transcriptional regulator n=1 Tax=Streptomyces sp. NPDC051577 TaxID=3155166 RepID=UPI003417EDC4
MSGIKSKQEAGKAKGIPESWNPEWRRQARCIGKMELFFATSNRFLEEAIAECDTCPVRTECLAVALDSRATHGIFAGTTPRWRNELLLRRPNVRSWRDLLLGARAEHRRRYDIPYSHTRQ